MATSHAASRERWERVERAFQATLDLPPEARGAYLDTACGQDAGLRREVEALLTARAAAGDFLAAPLDTRRVAALVEAASEDPTDPHEVGPYRIVRRLGEGGMGVVYLAHDSRLDRQVALKFLRPRRGMRRAARRRFVEEARTASALDDPHIASIYEIGETAEGELYIAMAHCAGETLRDRLERGPVAAGEAVEIAAQIAEGLAVAHGNGVVHRDVKPGNVMLSPRGTVKLVDFGIARAAGSAFTATGVRLGTPAYMSPEQIGGHAVDHRTDLWSLGVVLYEMLAGVRPFCADRDEAVLYAIRHDPPPLLDAACPTLPREVTRVVERCLQKDPADRYTDASALRADLVVAAARIERLVPAASRSARPPEDFRRWLAALKPIARRKPAVLAALALSLVLGILGLYWVSAAGDRGGASVQGAAAGAAPGIAILPFTIRGPELEVWHEGMVDLVSTNLGGVPGLRPIDSRTIMARWREAVPTGQTPDLTRALGIAADAGARYALTGSVVGSGSGLRLVATVHDLETGQEVGRTQVQGSPESIFELVDRLSIDILRAILRDQDGPLPRVDLASVTTTSLSALKGFLEGELLYNRSAFTRAIPAYQRAVEADSTFALALYRLSLCYGWGKNVDADLVQKYAAQAARNAGRLTDREALLLRGWLNTGTNARESLEELRAAVRKYPDDAEAWYLLGDLYLHLGSQFLIPPEEADKALERALQLDPGFTPAYIHLIQSAVWLRADSARAARLAEAYERLAPGSEFLRPNRLALELVFGDGRAAERARASLDTTGTAALRNLVFWKLPSPDLFDLHEDLLDRLRRRPDTPNPRETLEQLFWTRRAAGKLQAALDLLDEPVKPDSMLSLGLYALVHKAGVAVPAELADRALELATRDNAPEREAFYAATLAADLGRSKEREAILARLRAHSHGAPDRAAARDAVAALEGLEAYQRWRQGRPEAALSIMQRQQETGVFFDPELRLWIGQILLELDRPTEAEPYWRSFGYDPWAQIQLARIHEELGNPEQARKAWELTVIGWQSADPELRPRVEEARAALRRLIRSSDQESEDRLLHFIGPAPSHARERASLTKALTKPHRALRVHLEAV